LDRLTCFYWRVTRVGSSPESVITFYSPIARVESYPGAANCTIKMHIWIRSSQSTFVFLTKVNERILGAISSVPRATRSTWRRTRSPPKSTGTSIFVVREARISLSRRAQSSFISSRRICSRMTGIMTRSPRQLVRTRSLFCITSGSVNPHILRRRSNSAVVS